MRNRKRDNKKTISKKNIALIQLRDAIRLYYDKSYISSITLAAASEEILGKLSDEKYSRQMGRDAKNNFVDNNAFLIAHFIPNDDIDLTSFSEEEQDSYYQDIEKQYINDRNRTRNKLKHKSAGEKEIEFSNFRQIAEDHIAGAIVNYKLFKNELPEDEIIVKYSNEKGVS